MKGIFYNAGGQAVKMEPLVLSADWDQAIAEAAKHIKGEVITIANRFALVGIGKTRVLIVDESNK
ncbi:hypothetical protein [Aliivibrio sp. EL58]|uniref:hypothetical protein n=1 Tax=Aliivibrio sp. EL58 TaxID=2107582 RepID=UPI000EFD5E37|nr:hypothetical protein [Aliivibrio sp. EL58]